VKTQDVNTVKKVSQYKITEIFESIQGEGVFTGKWVTFVRFYGCNLKCPFCDTQIDKYKRLTLTGIMKRVKELGNDIVVFTGGEPTIQIDLPLLRMFRKSKYQLHIESNGATECIANENGQLINKMFTMWHYFNWVTISPKYHNGYMLADVSSLERADEVKLLVDTKLSIEELKQRITEVREYFQNGTIFLQPIEASGHTEENTKYVYNLLRLLEHEKWDANVMLNIQIHKILNVR